MYHDNATLAKTAPEAGWHAVQGEELAGFLGQIGTVDGKYRVSPDTTQVHWRQLSFYDNTVLVRVRDPNWVNKKLYIYYLTREGELYRLNGTSPPIHEVNAKAPIRVTEQNVLPYLKF